jgi:hypothetical protein
MAKLTGGIEYWFEGAPSSGVGSKDVSSLEYWINGTPQKGYVVSSEPSQTQVKGSISVTHMMTQ